MRTKSLFAIVACVFVVAFLASSVIERRMSLADEKQSRPKYNLELWVPEEELKVWDPVNPNVNPVPWRISYKTADGKRTDNFRHTFIGKNVQVEGLAWGYDVKTDLPKSRVIFEGGVVLVKGADFNKPDLRGKCVRVTGTLCLDTMPHPGYQLTHPFYYSIDLEHFEVIPQVNEPTVVLKEKEKAP